MHPSTPRSPQWSPSLRLPQQDPIHPLSSPIRATCPHYKKKKQVLQYWFPPKLLDLVELLCIAYLTVGKGKGKVHPCTGTEALYMPYGL